MLKQGFPVLCQGRNPRGEKCLKDAILVTVEVYQRDDDPQNINILPRDCPHNGGGHGGNCLAWLSDGANAQRLGGSDKKAVCPYSVDLPGGLEFLNFVKT